MTDDPLPPPRWPQSFLHWFCKSSLLEEIEGDIEEEYQELYETQGRFRARWFYLVQVVCFLRPFALRNFTRNIINPTSMIANYAKVAFRSLRRDQLNTAISTLGLFIATLCAMVIYLAISHETSYDAFHENADRIYRVNFEISSDQNSRLMANVGPPLGPAIETFYPEVEAAVRFRYEPTTIIATEDGRKRFYEDKIFYADPSVFDIFTYPLAQGDPQTALSEINNIVITTEVADKYFGDRNPLGEVLMYGTGEPLVVSGVLAPVPSNTHLPFESLRPFEAFKIPFGYPVTLDDWRWGSFHTYVLLDEAAHGEALEAKLPEFANTHFEEDQIGRMAYRLQPLQDIYFQEPQHDQVASGNYEYVMVLGSVGVLLLLLAAFNFTNIFTAKSLSRARETGLRKALGSTRSGLWVRYLLEPIMITLVTTVLSLLLLPYTLQFLNQQLGYQLTWDVSIWWKLAPVFMGIALVLGVMAGAYPAFIMSSFRPLSMLSGLHKKSRGGILVRKSLVTLQFSITSFLLIGSFIISAQIRFLQTKDLGFEQEHLVVLRMPGELLLNMHETIKNAFLDNPRVRSVSVGGGRMDGDTGNVPILAEGQDEPINMTINGVMEDFFKTVGVDILAGREFDYLHPADSAQGVILNELAARQFGWTPEEALNRSIVVGEIMAGSVVGVVDNFHFASLHQEVTPLVIYQPRSLVQNMYLRVDPGEVSSLVQSLARTWNELVPEVPLDFVFLDDHLQQMYVTDAHFARMVQIFSVITILIAVLGLYGLIALVSEQRMKEVSIRKVLGATLSSLILTLSRSFFTLIALANLIAWPLIYWLAQQWVSDFAYRIDIGGVYFGLALLITLGIAALTLVFQTRKVALTNPVKTLRQE